MRQILLLIVGFMLFSIQANASAFMGGELRTSYIGKDTHLVILVVYRDCKGVSIEDSALVKFESRDYSCPYIQNIYLKKYDCSNITPVCSSATSKCDTNTCNKYGYPNGSNPNATFQYGIERVEYRTKLYIPNSLSAKCCNFRLSYRSSNGRNPAITTCCAGDFFYTYAEFNRCLAAPNSLPEFAQMPDMMPYAGNCICMNLGARDTIDFDSLSYKFDKALSDDGVVCSYNAPYSWQNPIQYKGFPKQKPNSAQTCSGFVLDSITGDLCFMPTIQQVANLVINVYEWRRDSNGIIRNISTTRRDFQVIVVANKNNKPPIPSGAFNTIVCVGDSVKFHDMIVSDADTLNQMQRDSVRTAWNAAIPKGKFSIYYHGKNQYWNFDWLPTDNDVKDGYPKTYFFTVSATDNNCPSLGKFSKAFSITVKPRMKDSISIIDKGCGNLELKSYVLNNIKTTPQYLWNIPNGSSVYYTFKDGNIQYNKSGKIYLYHKTEANGCASVLNDSIDIKPFSEIHLPGDTSICYGDSILIRAHTFNALSPFQIYWNKSAVAGDSIFWAHPSKSSYIYATIKDTTGCSITDSLYITVHPLPTSGLLPNYIGCLGDTLNLDAWKNPSLIRNYQWTDSSGKWVSNTKSIKVTQSQKLYIQLEDTFGCRTHDSVRVNIYNLPQLQIPNQSICPGKNVTVYPGKYLSYQWSNGSLDSQVTIDSAGLYWLRVSSIGNCSTIDSFEVKQLSDIPQSLGNDTIICPKTELVLSAKMQAGSTHIFSTGSTAPNIKISSSGRFWISCISNDGCITTDTINISQFPTINVNLGNDTTICKGKNFQLKVPFVSGAKYFFNNNISSNSYTVYSAGQYIVECLTMEGCMFSDTLMLHYFPVANATFTKTNGTFWNSYNFAANDTNLRNYIWNYGDSGTTYNRKSTTHDFKYPGNYVIQLTVTDTNGCTSSWFDTLNIVSGISGIDISTQIYIIPNPASTSITIKGMETGNYILFDMQGRMILNGSININQSIDIAQLPIGLYILEVREEKMKSMGRTLLMKE